MAKNREKSPIRADLLTKAVAGVSLPTAVLNIPPLQQMPSDMWQIVVLGNIDTRQHFPQWYYLIKGISESELELATKSLAIAGAVLVNGVLSQPSAVQFDIGDFAIIVAQDRWTIQTVKENKRDRIRDVAILVFTKLNEIYISAYGINRFGHLRLNKTTAKQFMAKKVSEAGLALPSDRSEAQIIHTQHADATDTVITLSPSPIEENRLDVICNRHHKIRATKPEYYDVGKMLLDDTEADWRSAAEYKNRLAECLSREER